MQADEPLTDHNNTKLSLLNTGSLHSLEAFFIGFVNLGNLIFIFPQLTNKFGCVESTVASTCLDDFGLFLERKVFPQSSGLTIFLNSVRTSLCEMAPGLVKLYTPVSPCSARMMEAGRRS